MEENADAHFKNDDHELQASSRRILIAFALGLVFIVMAGIWSFVRYGQRAAEPVPAASVSLPRSASIMAAPTPKPLEYWQPKPFRIALLGRDRSMVQLSVAIEHRADPDMKKELMRREAQIREVIFFAVQKKPKATLLTSEGKDELRSELLIAINRIMRRPINDVYITEFFVR